MLSFLITIVIGSILLSLPFSAADGKRINYLDALFTATSATCVTGLLTMPAFSVWSAFGQAVILILIQIGGLGAITVLSGLMIFISKRFGLKNQLLMQDVFNLNSLKGIVSFTRRCITGTLIIEAIGALICMTVFIPDFGIRGIWISVFHSVSAFCNAGIDIISDSSLEQYAVNPVINIATCLLIILGGIGFLVWWDVIGAIKKIKEHKSKTFSYLSLHSKIALSMTAFLIIAGALAFFAFEYGNPSTLGGRPLYEKIEISLFQSVTTRTAGFATISQKSLTNSSAIVSLLLMFIGGSPVGTAGGVKTVTVFILFAALQSSIRNRREVSCFNRNIPLESIGKAVAVVGMSFIILFASTVALSAVTNADALDIVYETVSATATVGLSRSLTPSLGAAGKIIIIATMFFGRIGPISLATAFQTKKESANIVKNPTEQISVG